MNKLTRFFISGVMVLLTSSSIAEDNTTNLTFGLYTNDRPSSLIRQFTPILKQLELNMEAELQHNVTIDLKITKTYDDAIKLLADGTFDFVRFGPVSYTKAKDLNDDIKIVAAESVAGEKIFYGIVAIQANSDIKLISDLADKTFAFGDKSSTIGRYLSQEFLLDNEITETTLGSYAYLNRHDLVGKAVASGEFDAGALKENTFRGLVDGGYHIVELARFKNVTKPWIASANVSEEIATAISNGLFAITNPRMLGRLKINGFLPADDSDYDTIRSAVYRNFLFFR